jgi:hypothetical protein
LDDFLLEVDKFIFICGPDNADMPLPLDILLTLPPVPLTPLVTPELRFLRSCFTGNNSLLLLLSVEFPLDCVDVVVALPCELRELLDDLELALLE